MRYRQLGRSGLTVSVVGLGCNAFGNRIDEAQSARVIATAIECGITLLDTSNHNATRGRVLSAEEHAIAESIIGRAIKGHRQEVVLGTKFGNVVNDGADTARGARRYIRRAVEDSLRRLDTDYIDLYQLHRRDPRTPIEETLSALDDLVRAGKVLYVGSTNLNAWEITNADWTSRSTGIVRFVSAQNRYSLLERDAEGELLPACQALGIGFLPYFPLASGLLTGKLRRDRPAPEGSRLAEREVDPAVHDQIDALEVFGKERGVSLLEVAIGGLATRPAVASVISGATNPDQVRSNAEAGEWVPSVEDQQALGEVLGPYSEHSHLVVAPFTRFS